MTVKITQIQTVMLDPETRQMQIYGVGDDGNVYLHNSYSHPHHWELYLEGPDPEQARQAAAVPPKPDAIHTADEAEETLATLETEG